MLNYYNIVINGDLTTDVWNGSTKSTDRFSIDITDILDSCNNVSFVATGSTILALPQIIVIEYNLTVGIDSVKTEYTSVPSVYAGTNNTFTVTVSSSRDAKATLILYADGVPVDTIEANLTNGTNTILLTDQTIRPIDETTVNGAENHYVHYDVLLDYNGYYDLKELESVPNNPNFDEKVILI